MIYVAVGNRLAVLNNVYVIHSVPRRDEASLNVHGGMSLASRSFGSRACSIRSFIWLLSKYETEAPRGAIRS